MTKLFAPAQNVTKEITFDVYMKEGNVLKSLGSLTQEMTLPGQDEIEALGSVNRSEWLRRFITFKNPETGEVLDDDFVEKNIYTSVHATEQSVNLLMDWVNSQSPEKNSKALPKNGRKRF